MLMNSIWFAFVYCSMLRVLIAAAQDRMGLAAYRASLQNIFTVGLMLRYFNGTGPAARRFVGRLSGGAAGVGCGR